MIQKFLAPKVLLMIQPYLQRFEQKMVSDILTYSLITSMDMNSDGVICTSTDFFFLDLSRQSGDLGWLRKHRERAWCTR
jgi:hypothetical protein